MRTVVKAAPGAEDLMSEIARDGVPSDAICIFKGRNSVYTVGRGGEVFVIKSFRRQGLIGRIGYKLFRPSKAQRAYEYAARYNQAGIPTPPASGYVERYSHGLLADSYVVTRVCPGTSVAAVLQMPDFNAGVARALGKFVARMHTLGVFHGDMNLGNIFYTPGTTDDDAEFALIDINRSCFRTDASAGTCAGNLMRLTHQRPVLRCVVDSYARHRGYDPGLFTGMVTDALDRFEARKIRLGRLKGKHIVFPDDTFTVGVVISTYNNPAWLEKTLIGYLCQSRPADEIIIADDGSGPETRELIERYSSMLPIRHVWHPDRGFRKTEILNKAIAESRADYLIFTDQDCVPRADFVAVHASAARPGQFISGGYFKLSMPVSRAITEADIRAGRPFSRRWLRMQGMKLGFKSTKLLRSRLYAAVLNAVTPAAASWNGCNSSAWRTDIIDTNGFNEDMQYGGEDREFGERLVNKGIRPLQMRYSAIVVHLDHGRPYKNAEVIERNNAIRTVTRSERLTRTPRGIVNE